MRIYLFETRRGATSGTHFFVDHEIRKLDQDHGDRTSSSLLTPGRHRLHAILLGLHRWTRYFVEPSYSSRYMTDHRRHVRTRPSKVGCGLRHQRSKKQICTACTASGHIDTLKSNQHASTCSCTFNIVRATPYCCTVPHKTVMHL